MAYSVSLGSAASQNEGNPGGTAASFSFNLTRDAGEAGSVTNYRYELRNLDWTTATDFTVSSGTFTWGLGQVSKTNAFTITASLDSTIEANEQFVVWIYEDQAAPNNHFIYPLDPANPSIILTLVNDDAAPAFSSSASFSVAEGATAIGTVTATGSGTLTYALAGGDDDAKFAINASTGVLTLLAGKDFEAPDDVGGDRTYNIKVSASDGTNSTVQNIAVSLTNVNEAPTISSAAAANVPENTTTVLTATRTDPDDYSGYTDPVSWSIAGGADAAKFKINSSTGELSFVTAPDFEAPTDAGANNVYNVDIKATDGGGLNSTQSVAVTVTNVVGDAVITSNGGGAIAVLHVNENTTSATTLTTLTATDEEGDAITFSITGGADASRFAIASGNRLTFDNVLSFSPNYEAPADANGDNTYEVVVTAHPAAGGDDTQTLLIVVDNVAEAGDPTPPPSGGGGGGGGGGTPIGGTAGPDNLSGTSGVDSVAGGEGADTINGGDGNDWLDGDNGGDLLIGGAGDDFIRGLNDDDQVFGGDGADDVNGNLGQDFVDGGAGADTVRGGQGNDLVYGGEGDDAHVNGNIGDDQVFGGAGNDTVYGGQNNDTLFGEDGSDRLSGDLGNDILYGGAGADRFTIAAGGGVDWVADFNFAEGDRILLAPGTAYTMVAVGGQVAISLAGGELIGLAGVASSSFSADWVVFG